MSHLSRESCIELGLNLPTAPLIAWATEQIAAARVQETRLKRRGIQAPFLEELKYLVEQVGEGQASLGKERTTLPVEVTQATRVREEAFAYWQEVKQIVKIEFGTRPEIQAKFHLGVRTGRLIVNLLRELECDLALLRVHSTELSWLGVDETFLKKGETLIGKLNEARITMEAAIKGLPSLVVDQACKKGQLYDLTRKLVRCGKLEFIHEPEQAEVFNYGSLRKELRAGSEVRVRASKDAVRTT